MRRFFSRLVELLVTTADDVAAWGTRLLAGRGIRTAWMVVACLAAVPLLGFGTLQAVSVLAHEERTEVIEVDADGLAGLMVDNSAGSVQVVGVEGRDTVTVQARISEGLRGTGHDVSRRDDWLFVEGSCPILGSEWCRVHYTIEVPADLHVDVRAMAGVEVSDLSGGLSARSSTSRVEIARVGGDITLQANQGRVAATDLTAESVHATAAQGRISLAFAVPPDEVVASASQGRIEIVLPDVEGVYYAIDSEARQGSVTENVATDPRSDRTIEAQANQGRITIAYAAG
jgi:hypothetical protein